MRVLAPKPIKVGSVGVDNGVAFLLGRVAKAVEDAKDYERGVHWLSVAYGGK